MGRAVMVTMGNSKFVGIPKIVEASEDGLDVGYIERIEDCVEMITTTIPVPIGSGEMEIKSFVNGVRCGDIIEFEGAIVIDLRNDSAYYTKYVEVTTNLSTPTGGQMRDITTKRH